MVLLRVRCSNRGGGRILPIGRLRQLTGSNGSRIRWPCSILCFHSSAFLLVAALAALSSASAHTSVADRVQSLLSWSEGSNGGDLPVDAKMTMLHGFVAKKLGKLGGFQKFARRYSLTLSNNTNSLLEKARRIASLQVDKDAAASRSELASLKLEYKALKKHKRELVQKAKTLTEEVGFDEIKRRIKTAGESMLLMKRRMIQLGYNGHDSLTRQQRYTKLYSIRYGGTGYKYHNNPDHPGVNKDNDGGAYSKYGWRVNPDFVGEQKCEEYSQCPDVFRKGNHNDSSATCQDDPTYHDCDGDSCEYYEENPDECGKNDHDCGGEGTGHWAGTQENPCKSQGVKMQGCCVCQHHKEQFDGCGSQDVGEFSDGWECTESPTEYQDAGCGTWETCEERIAKENGWTDRNGHKCEVYEENPEMCDDARSRLYKGHDAAECCPKLLDRPCGHEACPAGTFGVSAGRRSETINTTCTRCPAGKYNPDSNQHSDAACVSCPAGTYNTDEGADNVADCLDCAKGKYSTAIAAITVDTCTECSAGKYSTKAGSDNETNCEDCPSGTYNANTGSDDPDDCTDCDAGKAQPIMGATSDTDCKDCESGKYSASAGSDLCTDCAQGKYSDTIGARSEDVCTQCPAGKYDSTSTSEVATSDISCAECPQGTYSTSTGAESDVACIQCLEGKYGDTAGSDSESGCTPCQAGKYGNTSGEATPFSCLDCDQGKFSSNDGATICSDCEKGKYSTASHASSSDTCSSCTLTSYSNMDGATVCGECVVDDNGHTANEGNTGCLDKCGVLWGDDTSCIPPPPSGGGDSGDDGASSTPPPPPGTGTDGDGTGGGDGGGDSGDDGTSSPPPPPPGTDCGAGYTGPQGSCTLCEAGKYKGTPGSDACTDCDAGKHSTSGSEACTNCNAGTYADAGHDKCDGCAPGTFSSVDGASTCEDCEAGKFSTDSSNSACTDCRAGTFSATTASTTCTPCATGKYSASTAASDASTCTDCGAGKYATSGSESCTDCGEGKYSATTAASSENTCTMCAAGKFSPEAAADDESDCTACEAGKASAAQGASAEASCATCVLDTYSEATGSAHCSVCPNGKLTASTGSTAEADCLTPCNAGYAGTLGGTCIACAAGKYKPPVFSDGELTFNEFQHGHGEADCLNCPVHLYQNQEGQTGCIPCPANSETTGEASQAASDCLCSPGYQSSDGGISGHADANTCNSCHKMHFKTGLGPGACDPCQGASHSGTAWAKCRCNHGYSGEDGDGSSCAACPPGTYKDLTGSVPCKDCPVGKHGYTQAATSDDFCRETYKIKFGASMVSNHPSASGNQGATWNYGASKDQEFGGGGHGPDEEGGTMRYGGNGAYGEWAVDENATNFNETEAWNGRNGGNPGGPVKHEDFGEWHKWAKVDEHHDADNLNNYLNNETQDARFGQEKA